jgi:phosphatidylserine/phosphatidylglycerophosphate/cardiolipin synthase-like enzyme
MTTEGGLIEHVRHAASRGVYIRLVGDRKEALSFFSDLARGWDLVTPLPELWIGTEAEGWDWLMHCKVVMADNRDILIGSANFTRRGLETNAELGIRISDSDIGGEVELFFNYLQGTGLIEPFTSGTSHGSASG